MNTPKHTPGPLDNVTGYKPGPWIRQVLNDESEAYIHDKHCNAIARVYSLSDAALIAAAPAMYEALQDAYEKLCYLAPDKFDDEEHAANWQRDLSTMLAALAQAEGSKP